jgi:outer membrane lipoprotein-sorting protein
MKHQVVMFLAVAAALWVTGCQMISGNPKAETILKQMTQTVDPEHKLPAVKSSAFAYDMSYGGKYKSECLVSLKSPSMLRFENKTSTNIDIIGYDGKAGWEFDSSSGLRQISGQELEELKFQATNLAPNSRIEDIFSRTVLDGSEVADGEDCWKLTGYPKAEFNVQPVIIFISKQSHLLLKTVEKQTAGNTTSTVTTHFRNYKLSGGVMLPFTVVTVTAEQTINCKLKSVQWNPVLADSLFAPPLPEPKK